MENNIATRSATLELALNKKISAPIFTDKQSNGNWVPYKTADNKEEYPNYLIGLANNSALHSRILKSVINQVCGNGFVWDPSSANATQLAEFAKKPNESGEDLNEILKKYVTDYCTFGAGALKADWNIPTWSTVTSLEHVDTSKIRMSPIDDYGNIISYWWSWDWTNNKCVKKVIAPFSKDKNKKKAEELKGALDDLNVNKLTELFTTNSQLLYSKMYEPNSAYYAHPYYQAGMNAIETDIMSTQYEQSSFENGLGVDYVITIFGNYTDEQKKVEAQAILRQHTGSMQQGKPMITFAKDKEQGIQVDKLDGTGENKLFTSINENIVQKICEAHGITSPLLVGIKTAGQLGGSQELQIANELFQTQVIKPIQFEVCKAFNKILEVNQYPSVSIEPIKYNVEDVATKNPDSVQESGNNAEFK